MDLIPQMPNYENFLKASNKAFPLLTAFMQLLLLQNQLNNESRHQSSELYTFMQIHDFPNYENLSF